VFFGKYNLETTTLLIDLAPPMMTFDPCGSGSQPAPRCCEKEFELSLTFAHSGPVVNHKGGDVFVVGHDCFTKEE
jgi:hypothetical protein